MKPWLFAGLFALAVLPCCSGPAVETEPDDPRVVAIYSGGEIDLDQLDDHIVSRPPAQRRLPGRDLVDWFDELTRQLAFEDLMRLEAEQEALDQDEMFLETQEAARRSLLVDLCVAQRHRLEIDQPTGEELRQEFDKSRDQFVQQERRLVYNLFLQRREGVPPAELFTQLLGLRDRAMGGENFSRLAEEFSDSETRHQDGLMGWIQRGVLNPDLEEIVFGLEDGVPSDPLITAEGGHLYYVDETVERRELPFEEVEERLRSQVISVRREDAVADWEDSLELPAGSFVPTQSQFFDLARRGDPEAAIFRIGDHEVKLATFQALFQQVRGMERSRRRGQPQNPRERAWQVLKQMERREVVYAHCQAEGGVDEEDLAEALRKWRAKTLPTFATQRRIDQWASHNQERLKEFYEANPGRFSTPPRWQLRRLTLPREGDPYRKMVRLEQAVEALNERSLTLEDLAEELGGEVDELGWRTLPELSAFHPRVPSLVSPLQAGEHTPPFSLRDSLVVLEVIGREEPESRAFDDVREGVRSQFLAQHREEAWSELQQEVLAGAKFEVFPDRLEALRESWRNSDPTKNDELVTGVIELLEEIEASEE